MVIDALISDCDSATYAVMCQLLIPEYPVMVTRYAGGEKVMAAEARNCNGDRCAGVCQLIIPGDSAGVC